MPRTSAGAGGGGARCCAARPRLLRRARRGFLAIALGSGDDVAGDEPLVDDGGAGAADLAADAGIGARGTRGVDRRAFERLLEEFPPLERQLLRRTMDELEHTRRWMLLLGRKSAEEKVASFLLHVTGRLKPTECPGANPNASTYQLPLTRGQIADVLGLTIETVSRQMTKLKSAGVVALPDARSVTILSKDRLEDLAEAA